MADGATRGHHHVFLAQEQRFPCRQRPSCVRPYTVLGCDGQPAVVGNGMARFFGLDCHPAVNTIRKETRGTATYIDGVQHMEI